MLELERRSPLGIAVSILRSLEDHRAEANRKQEALLKEIWVHPREMVWQQCQLDSFLRGDVPKWEDWEQVKMMAEKMMEVARRTRKILRAVEKDYVTPQAAQNTKEAELLISVRSLFSRHYLNIKSLKPTPDPDKLSQEPILRRLAAVPLRALRPQQDANDDQTYAYGSDCRLGTFWTAITLFSIAERVAMEQDATAQDRLSRYLEVRDRFEHRLICKGKIRTEEEMKAALNRFVEQRSSQQST